MAPGSVVYVVDDDAGVRRHLFELLNKQGSHPISYASGADFLDSLDFIDPGILLLEWRLPAGAGAQVLEQVVQRRRDIAPVVMAANAEVRLAVDLIKHGAVDFLEKPFADDALLASLAKVRAELDQAMAERRRRDEASSRLDSLSDRERDVMRGLLVGMTNKDLARELHLSPRTVEMHRARMMKKMGARNLIDALRIAVVANFGRAQGLAGNPGVMNMKKTGYG